MSKTDIILKKIHHLIDKLSDELDIKQLDPEEITEDMIEENKVGVPPGWVKKLDTCVLDGDKNYYIIRQTIDIDLSKQPVELVFFWMTSDKVWWGSTHKPKKINSHWAGSDGFTRQLLKSEYPTNYKGDWRDSLLVRPEAWNNGQ